LEKLFFNVNIVSISLILWRIGCYSDFVILGCCRQFFFLGIKGRVLGSSKKKGERRREKLANFMCNYNSKIAEPPMPSIYVNWKVFISEWHK